MLDKLIECIRNLFKHDVLDEMLDNFNYDAELRLKEERLKRLRDQAGSDPMKQIDYIIENGFEKFNDLMYGDVGEKKMLTSMKEYYKGTSELEAVDSLQYEIESMTIEKYISIDLEFRKFKIRDMLFMSEKLVIPDLSICVNTAYKTQDEVNREFKNAIDEHINKCKNGYLDKWQANILLNQYNLKIDRNGKVIEL